MNEFCWDVKQKKSVAASAKHRVNGARSTRVTMPSDLLTPAQRRELNGEVKSVNLNKPITWEELKALPPSMAKEYVETLHKVHKATGNGAARMLGIYPHKYNEFVRQIGADISQHKGGRQTREDAETFARFCGHIPSEETAADSEPPAPEETEVYTPPAPVQELHKAAPAQLMTPDRLSITVTGDLDQLAAYIKLLPMDGRLRMTLTLEKIEEEE